MSPIGSDPTPFITPTHRNVRRRWADGALVYHIYPRSFMDSNGDGIGDLPGVISKLDYLKDLGVSAIWLSPFYPSPMADFGYDVADYCNVDPMFGTLDDFKDLMSQAEERNMRVMIDLVPNHTSDEHKWFIESRKSAEPTNPFRDWYIWRDGMTEEEAQKHDHDITPETGARPVDAAGGLYPPNNWRDALTGGPAWQWDHRRKQFYLHSFDVRQPDLNWGNPAVREAVKAAMRFWLDIGVDGFRVDAVYWMAKEPLFSDDLPEPNYEPGVSLPYHALRHDNSRGWPAVYAYLTEMADVLHEEKYRDKQRFMVTEAYPEGHNPLVEYLNFYVGMEPEVSAPFNFEGLIMPWQATRWRKFLRAFHGALDQIDPHCVPSYAFGNHDQPRIMSRIGEQQSRAAAVLLLTLPGMVFLYYGDEIGMKNGDIPKEFVQDPGARGEPVGPDGQHRQGRDPQRTPMQWTAGRNAGFSTAETTWLPVAENFKSHNVESESKTDDSFLSLYKVLGTLRAGSATLKHGGLQVIDTGQTQVLGFVRTAAYSDPTVTEATDEDIEYVVLVNFSEEVQHCALSQPVGDRVTTSIGSATTPKATASSTTTVKLRPFEAAVYVAGA